MGAAKPSSQLLSKVCITVYMFLFCAVVFIHQWPGVAETFVALMLHFSLQLCYPCTIWDTTRLSAPFVAADVSIARRIPRQSSICRPITETGMSSSIGA